MNVSYYEIAIKAVGYPVYWYPTMAAINKSGVR